jgi:SHS2 domain-containing protein
MPYHYLEEVATADIAFEAWGKDLEKTFGAAADATINVMAEELESIRPLQRRDLNLENDALDMLLFDFLQELIYYKDAERLLLRPARILIRQADRNILEATVEGEEIDPTRHRLRVDVKAVTLHRFALEKTPEGWKAMVILDI